MDLFEGLIDSKIHKVTSVFLHNPDELFHINKVSNLSEVPLATTFRIMKQLLELEIITSISIAKFKIYKLSDNNKTRQLRRLL